MPREEVTSDNPFGVHAHLGDATHRHRGAAAHGDGTAAHGTIPSIGEATFVLTTKQGKLTVATGADTHYHSPTQIGWARKRLAFADLKVGQRVGVQGERLNDATLLAKRVHIANP
jgi:hypothetical protein